MRIHDLAVEGDAAGLRAELLHVEVDVRERGLTALMMAAESPTATVEILAILVDAGADVNAVGSRELEERPIRGAIRDGNLDKIRYLLSAGAELSYRTQSGYAAVLDAVYSEQASCALLDLVAPAGMPSPTQYGETPLRVASHVGDMELVAWLLAHGADAGELGFGPLLHAAALGSLDALEAQLARSVADLEAADVWQRTPLLLCLQLGKMAEARALRRAGASLDVRDRAKRGPLALAATHDDPDVIRWLVDEGCALEEVDLFDQTPLLVAVASARHQSLRELLRLGAELEPPSGTAVSAAPDRETLRILVDAGAYLGDVSAELRQSLRGEGKPASLAEFVDGAAPRFGQTNPSPMDLPFWHSMIHSGQHAYTAATRFEVAVPRPIWCAARFGQSLTFLPDGRMVEIGGEHEDFYDADFCIYNDVFVHGDGSLQIFGYPKEVFAPTDFHSATYVDGAIYIIGNVGYVGTRQVGTTPVYRLDCQTWAITRVATSGDGPGWVHRHRARADGTRLEVHGGQRLGVDADGKEVWLDGARHVLDLATGIWTKID